MNQYVAVFRTQEGIEEAAKVLENLKERYKTVPVQDKGRIFNTNLLATLELGFMLDCAETIVAGALERKESRGAHTRLDYPNRDDENWMKHILLSHTPEGPKMEYQEVKVTEWEPMERTY